MFSKTSRYLIFNRWPSYRLLPLAGLLAGFGATAFAQSVPFPTYSVGENKSTTMGPNYPSTLPTP